MVRQLPKDFRADGEFRKGGLAGMTGLTRGTLLVCHGAFIALSVTCSPALSDDGDRCAAVAQQILSKPETQLLSLIRNDSGCRIVYLERNLGKRARRVAVQIPSVSEAPARIAIEEKQAAKGTVAVVGK
jgi:hypothetical protein